MRSKSAGPDVGVQRGRFHLNLPDDGGENSERERLKQKLAFAQHGQRKL